MSTDVQIFEFENQPGLHRSPRNGNAKVWLTCTEPYFLSEGVYATPEELENTREVTLHVITIGAFIEDSTRKDDFTSISTELRKYLPEKDTPYVLDIDLDFFSTKNPFKSLHDRVNLYDKLAPLFTYKRTESNDPEVLKESMMERNEQLAELENLFRHLDQYRSLQAYEGAKTSRYEAVELICREVRGAYKESEIDWMLVYDAGCTIDDTALPEHVTESNDLDRLISGTLRLFLAALPTTPTIVTIARSSDDDYCPPENVEQIQFAVLDELRLRLGAEVDIKLAYQQDEEQQ